MNNRFQVQIMILSIAIQSGCTPTRVSDEVKLVDVTNWHHAPANQASETDTDLKAWWKGFQDPLLNDLIAQALKNNHDLRIAKARVREAETLITIADSALYPSIDMFSSGGRGKKIDQIWAYLANKVLS